MTLGPVVSPRHTWNSGRVQGQHSVLDPSIGTPKLVVSTWRFFFEKSFQSKKSWSFRCQFSIFFLEAAMKTNKLCSFSINLCLTLAIFVHLSINFCSLFTYFHHDSQASLPSNHLRDTEIWWAQRGQQCGNHPSDGLQKLSGTQGDLEKKHGFS